MNLKLYDDGIRIGILADRHVYRLVVHAGGQDARSDQEGIERVLPAPRARQAFRQGLVDGLAELLDHAAAIAFVVVSRNDWLPVFGAESRILGEEFNNWGWYVKRTI